MTIHDEMSQLMNEMNRELEKDFPNARLGHRHHGLLAAPPLETTALAQLAAVANRSDAAVKVLSDLTIELTGGLPMGSESDVAQTAPTGTLPMVAYLARRIGDNLQAVERLVEHGRRQL